LISPSLGEKALIRPNLKFGMYHVKFYATG
jgi:hypothetical protein